MFKSKKLLFLSNDYKIIIGMQNLPFGEPFIDQRATSYDIRYKFTGKEMDTETGYQFPIAIGIGARYYNSDISVWLSVDPASELYPNESSYCYAGLNPIMITDPNGMWKDEGDGNWTAEKGDSWWKLHKQSGMSWEETMDFAKKYNADKDRDNWKSVRVGDQVSLPGSGSNSNESSNSGIDYTPSKEQQNISMPENYDPGSISQYEQTKIDKWSESSNFFASLSYGIIDDYYVYGTSLIFGPSGARHLTGEGANRSEITNAGLNSISNSVPIGSLGKFLGIEKKVLNAAKYGMRFKGTGAVRVPHSVRGLNIKKFNNVVRVNNQARRDIYFFERGSTIAGSVFGN